MPCLRSGVEIVGFPRDVQDLGLIIPERKIWKLKFDSMKTNESMNLSALCMPEATSYK